MAGLALRYQTILKVSVRQPEEDDPYPDAVRPVEEYLPGGDLREALGECYLTEESCPGYLDHHYQAEGLSDDQLERLIDFCGVCFEEEGGGMLSDGIWPSFIWYDETFEIHRLYVCPLPAGESGEGMPEERWRELIQAMLDRHAPDFRVDENGDVVESDSMREAV